MHPEKSLTDFEIASMNVVSKPTALPRTVIESCLFHFAQSIWKRMVNEGLKEANSNDDDDLIVRNEIRELTALPFIHAYDV